MSNTESKAGIPYNKPFAVLMNESGLGVAEYAARTCYDSFELSESEEIKKAHWAILAFMRNEIDEKEMLQWVVDAVHIDESDLLDKLAWTYFHHSILEHVTLSYVLKGTSRGVLQEHARHRIQAISVRSTRYTMSDILYAFIASQREFQSKNWFGKKIKEFEMFTVSGDTEWLEINHLYEKLYHQMVIVGTDEFNALCLSKENIDNLAFGDADDVFKKLQGGKKKRNVGDNFKWVVTDNWKVDLVVTFNLRSLKNYFDLRDSGAAYFQIEWLAQEMKRVTPNKYLALIDKKYKKD